jgi:hypothetical protein
MMVSHAGARLTRWAPDIILNIDYDRHQNCEAQNAVAAGL